MMKILLKIDRFMAWVLMISMVLFFISGYGLSKGIMDRGISGFLHLKLLVYSSVISFGYHSAFAIHLSLRRWKIWNFYSKTGMFIFYCLYLSGFIYTEVFFERPVAAVPATPARKVFTLDELKKFDGKEGRPAYAAVDGLVYDFSTVYKEGTHYEHIAGAEHTQAFYSYHKKEELQKYPVVGEMKK